MKDIGELLKQKRLEKGLTIDQIVEITRMPATRIKAIEEGDISTFKDDITYLQFFVQSYCRALGLDYREIKDQLNDSINGYTMAFQAEQLRSHGEIEKNIREKSNQRIKEYQVRNKPKRVKRKIDFSLISFLLIIMIIGGCVIFVGGKYLKEYFNQPEPPVVETPQEDDKPQINEPEPPVVEKEIEVVQSENNVNTFVIHNAKEKFMIKIEFVPSSWYQLKLDGVVQKNPTAKIYNAGEVLEIEIDPEKTQEIEMRFGYFAKMKLYVDAKEVQFDASIANYPGVQDIVFQLGGETDENEFAE